MATIDVTTKKAIRSFSKKPVWYTVVLANVKKTTLSFFRKRGWYASTVVSKTGRSFGRDLRAVASTAPSQYWS